MSANDALSGRQFGTNVRRALNHPEVYNIIDSHPDTHGSTPQAGACRATAEALHQVLPGSSIHGVESSNGIEHFVVHHEGRFYDSRGGVSAQGLTRRWKRDEPGVGPVHIRPVSNDEMWEHESPDPVDAGGTAISDKLATHLRKHLIR